MKNTTRITWIFGLLVIFSGQTAYAERLHSPDQDGVSGLHVNEVVFANGGQRLGHFAQTGYKEWTEFTNHNRPAFYFKELDRNYRSVSLYDTSRDVYLELDLRRQNV